MITDSANGLDAVLPRRVGPQLAPKITDMHVNAAIARSRFSWPGRPARRRISIVGQFQVPASRVRSASEAIPSASKGPGHAAKLPVSAWE